MTTIQSSTNPLHSLLLQTVPTSTTNVHYKPHRLRRKRPRVLHHYPDNTLLLLNPLTHTPEHIFTSADLSRYGNHLYVKGHGYLKFDKTQEPVIQEILRQREWNGDWRWIRKVGSGSGGSVWLVEKDGRYMGVKVVEKEGIAEGDTVLKRAVEERRALENIGGEFVVGLEEAWQSEKRLYMGTRWFEYGDLGRVMSGRYLRDEVAKGVMAEIVLGLEELQEMGYVHRDLKVENVLVDERGHVAIGDLGMVKDIRREDGRVGKTRSFCGTRSSMSPEMLMGKDYGFSVDMWALGVLMYRLLTGRLPFGRVSRRDLGGQVASSIHLFHEIKTADIKYPSYLSAEAVSLLKGLFDRYVGDRLDLVEVKSHEWFRDIDWEQVKSEARMRQPKWYAKELLSGAKPLIAEDEHNANTCPAQCFSKVTLSDIENCQDAKVSSEKEKKAGKLSPWASGRLIFSSKGNSAKPSSWTVKRKCRTCKDEQKHVKIWGYDYHPAVGAFSSVSSSPISSRRESEV